MTNRDDLVRFAARMVGVNIQLVESEFGSALTWVQVDDDDTPVADFEPFTWDWMGRGMEVCPYVASIRKDQFGSSLEIFRVHVADRVEPCAQVDVPLKFWTLWQEMVEG